MEKGPSDGQWIMQGPRIGLYGEVGNVDSRRYGQPHRESDGNPGIEATDT